MAQPTYPLALPTIATRPRGIWAGAEFHLSRPVLSTPFIGGQTQRVEIADGFWTIRYESLELFFREILELRAVFDSLQGGMKLLLATDPAHPFPRDYPNGFAGMLNWDSTPFDGTMDVTSLATENGLPRIQCQNAPDNFSMRRGDYVELREGTQKCLFRITGNSSEFTAGTMKFWIEPSVPSFFTTAAVVNLASPGCLAVVDPDSFHGAPGRRQTVCSFTARQQVWVPA